MKLLRLLPVAVIAMVNLVARGQAPADEWFAGQKLVQEINCARPAEDVVVAEYPRDISKVESILGKDCRVLPTAGTAKYVAFRVGQGKGLKGGAAYVLAVDYPEDRSRSILIGNWGCETALGFATGQSLGDVLRGRYVNHNPESIKYLLSGKYQTWSQLFYLHDRFADLKRPRNPAVRPMTPEDGFWVIFAQMPSFQDPMGAGTAVSRIRLYEVADPAALDMKLNLPPKELPRRRVFSREEMADGVANMGHKPEEKDEKLRGVKDIVRWHEDKMRVIKFLGGNTYSKDLLEFGHNQGWDSGPGGGNAWVNQSSTPWLWEKILEKAAVHGLDVLPMYEYRGSFGQDPNMSIAARMKPRRLDGGKTYTHISWCEKGNADITDPATLADACKLLDHTITAFKDKVNFAGAWFRHRPTGMPVSFNDDNLKMFAAEANNGAEITREKLQADKALLDRYYQWWFGKRVAFFEGVRDHLRKTVGPDATLVYTNDVSEPGVALPGSIVVNDDPAAWDKALKAQKESANFKSMSLEDVVKGQMHLKALAAWHGNWGNWEWNHAVPPNDPANWVSKDGMMLTYTFNRLYTVGDAPSFDAYRGKSGLAAIRHYPLNENDLFVDKEDILGYYVMDVERSGPYCMMAEARAVANGDPVYLGSLTANTYNHGFPQYVRKFNAAFLSLPALPSEVVKDAASDAEVVVRQIKTEKHGTYLAIVNTGLAGKQGVSVKIPAGASVQDAATGQPVTPTAGALTLDLYPAELRTIRVQ